MTLRREQLRALAFARKLGTEAPVEAIRSRVRSTFVAFERLVDAIPSETARTRPPEGGWSVQEVVDHLIESDRRGAAQLAELLDGTDVDEAIPAGLVSSDPLAHDWTALRQRFRTVHETHLELLERASDEHPLDAKVAVEMVVKCAGPDGVPEPVAWIERFDWKAFAILGHAHNREHIAQVHRILGEIGGEGAG